MKIMALLCLAVLLLGAGSVVLAETPRADETPPLPKLRPGFPEKISLADVWSLVDTQPNGIPGCTRRLRFEGKQLTGSRVYYQAMATKWRKSQERISITYAFVGTSSMITEVTIGDQNYYREDRAEAFFQWDQRLPWEK